MFRYHEDNSKKLNACSSPSHTWFIFNLNTKISSFTDHILQYLHVINACPTRPLLLLPCVYLLGEPAFLLSRGGEFPSTLVPGLLTTAPPLAGPFTPSHPTHRSSYNVYIDDINNTSRPRLAQIYILDFKGLS